MPSPSSTTRQRLLRTAERLFARNGIDAVSMRAICVEADQRNNTALQYHFGDKSSLIEAILESRMSGINAQRETLLAEIRRDEAERDLPRLVRALVAPFTQQLCDEDGGRDYVRFAAQLFSRGDAMALLGERRPWTEAFHCIVELITACLEDVPRPVIRARLALMAGQLVHASAAKDYELDGAGPRQRARDVARFSTDLVDYIVGGLTAPVSTAAAGGRPGRSSAAEQRT